MELPVSTNQRRKPIALTTEQLGWAVRYETLRRDYFQRQGYDVTPIQCQIDSYFSRLQEAGEEIPQMRDADASSPVSAGATTVEGWA